MREIAAQKRNCIAQNSERIRFEEAGARGCAIQNYADESKDGNLQ